jgi:hypothetical protein
VPGGVTAGFTGDGFPLEPLPPLQAARGISKAAATYSMRILTGVRLRAKRIIGALKSDNRPRPARKVFGFWGRYAV